MLTAARTGAGPQEGIDHLFLLPERVLSMDSASLRQDLAGLDFSVTLLHGGPKGNVWLSGAAPESQRNSRPLSATTKQGQGCASSWSAEEAETPASVSEVYAGSLPLNQGKESAASLRDREERLRVVKEKQNEERQKKLEELKQQALAAQKFREQKEEERRRRMEELRLRDTDRRHQVEERKRQIWEAERDRREAILRKNQEREARIETKRRNERSSIVFAFGSSTPRMLEPADTGGSYWAARRATSTSNVMTLSMSAAPGPLTRRSSERELDGSKKRATSAGGIDRTKQPGEDGDGEESGATSGPTPAAGAPSARPARRKTDLMPTMPSPRDLTSRHMRSPGLRSGEVTPSRPQSSLSQHSMSSSVMSSSVHAAFKPRAMPRRPRPYSIAVTGVTVSNDTTSAPATARHSLSTEHRNAKSPASVPDKEKPPLPKVHAKKPATPKPEAPKKPTDKIKSTKSSATATPKATPLQSPGAEPGTTVTTSVTVDSVTTTKTVDVTTVVETAAAVVAVSEPASSVPTPQEVPAVVSVVESHTKVNNNSQENVSELVEYDMTASMLAKTRITTEEEAKAALAERRRLAREQAEREAELERQRVEAERLAEEQRLREEEEEQRRMEEEQLRLLEDAQRAEQERLRQAIEEAQKREEEERLQREEDARQKVEKEEAERKAREEAEKQRQEMEIRLKKEEEDRLARRKRVEIIMSRTRGKGSTPANTPTKEDGDESPGEESGRSEPGVVSDQDQFLHSERSHSSANNSEIITAKQNGHQNGVDNVVEQNNVTNNLLDLSIEGTGQILTPSTPTNGKLTNEDSVNFNTPLALAPATNPFIAFPDNKKQDTVNDLLS